MDAWSDGDGRNAGRSLMETDQILDFTNEEFDRGFALGWYDAIDYERQVRQASMEGQLAWMDCPA
jgi:hypothetical protein